MRTLRTLVLSLLAMLPAAACRGQTVSARISTPIGAARAGRCRPTVDALTATATASERINIDQNRELAAKFGVDAIPCFVVVEHGKEVDRIVGQTSIERLKLKLRENAFNRARREATRLLPKPSPNGGRILRGATKNLWATVRPSFAFTARTTCGPDPSARARW